MQAVGRLGSYISRGIYTVSGGAVDIVVVRQKDGSFKSSPWYVRFGKFHRVLKAEEKGKVKVDISVNGVEPDFHMYLNSKREAIFLHAETQEEEESVFCYGETDDIDIQQVKSISCNFDSSDKPNSEARSRRSRILGIVRSLRGGEGEDGEVNRVDSMGRAEIAAKLLEVKWSTNLTFDQGPSRDRKKTRGDAFNNGLRSQQRDCMCHVGDVGNKPNFRKSQTVNIGPRDCLVKKVCANTPTSQQLASLNLKEGRNTITFSFSTAMGTQQVDAQIYLWKWNTRIVISDVDGTITRSDVLGQFMPLVGIDWSQTGVAHLFSDIKENGYQLLFLSARAISQAYHTRQFLCNLKQDGKVLPDGPVVISPDGLFPSLYREVIRRAPHEFKISCLEDIRALFPPECNPFYAGFGNRDTDEVSYLKVGIPKGKIFIINPRGEIAVNRRCFDTQSYTSLHALVHEMFPPTNSSEQEDFNSWNYWKLP